MSGGSDKRGRRRAVRVQLDNTVVGIELTLISIIQGLALGVLAASSVQPLIAFQWQIWPYIAAGLLTCAGVGFAATMAGKPFLAHFSVPLPSGLSVSSTILFDLGVYLLVLGLMVTAVTRLASEDDQR